MKFNSPMPILEVFPFSATCNIYYLAHSSSRSCGGLFCFFKKVHSGIFPRLGQYLLGQTASPRTVPAPCEEFLLLFSLPSCQRSQGRFSGELRFLPVCPKPNGSEVRITHKCLCISAGAQSLTHTDVLQPEQSSLAL